MKTAMRLVTCVSLSVLLAVFVGFAQVRYQYKCGSDHVNLMENNVWVENSEWKKQCELRLDDTNPTFFALVYNTLKDCSLLGKGTCVIWCEKYTRPDGETYTKIIHVSVN